jgi:hypothetical protein
MCYYIVFEEERLIKEYMMEIIIRMMKYCVIWKNNLIGNDGNYIVNWKGYLIL